MLVQQMDMLGYIAIIEICNPNIKKYIKQERKIKNGEIEPVINKPNRILHGAIDPEYPEWLDQEVQQQQQSKIDEEFLLHYRFVKKI